MLNTEYKFGEVHNLASQIQAAADKVHFHNIFANDNGGVVLLAFKAAQQLATHVAPAEVMVNVLEGEVDFLLNDGVHSLKAGDFMLLGAGVEHSVSAKSDAKVMLIKVKSDK